MGRKAGFTLIELMIVVAIVGFLAAVAIPSYSSYVTRSKISEVTHSFDALATAAAEYHASLGYWPTNAPNQLASLSNRKASWAYVDNGVNNIRYRATIANITPSVDGCILIMNITYDLSRGYRKSWDRVASDLGDLYMPRE
ncbi:MAG: prepilin-type N-terminal cleavage/methylation domain-containing protein [Deltaproteobacteria bacterium]|nr:prepilin-type N-terminal cleavage/methylation domain-containing protein [Deltaproteobacteria bacterium]